MSIAINCILLVCATTCCICALSLFVREKNIQKLRWIMLFMGMYVMTWCGMYSFIGFSTNVDTANILRIFGVIGIVGFLCNEVVMAVQLAQIKSSTRNLLYTIIFAVGVLDGYFYSRPGTVYYVFGGRRTVFYQIEGAKGLVTHNIFLVVIISILIICGFLWASRVKYSREKRFVKVMFATNIAMAICILFDTFLPRVTSISIPLSGVGAAITYVLMWYAITRYNAFSATVNHMADYIYDTVESGFLVFNLDGQLELCNPYAEKLLEIDLSEKKTARDVFGWDENEGNLMIEEMRTKGMASRKYINEKNGIHCDLKFVIAKDVKEEEFAIVCTLYDITREEKMLIDLEDANTAKKKFLANVSHEIRTPLHSVLSFNELIIKSAKENDMLANAVQTQSAARSLLAMIDNIMDYMKLEDNALSIDENTYQIQSLLQDILLYTREEAGKKSIFLDVSIDPNIPVSLMGDAVKISQIINNIIANALKYTHQGMIFINVGWEASSTVRGKLSVDVRDTGVGISKSELAKIKASINKNNVDKQQDAPSNLGLGLTVVAGLIDLMDGQFNIDSEYGEGTRVSICIEQGVIDERAIGKWNWESVEETVSNKKNAEVFKAPNVRLLAVDDNKMNLDILGRFLMDTQIKIDYASNGKDALDKIIANRDMGEKYDIILMDHMMPEMDGLQTIREIKRRKLCPDTKVIAFTANTLADMRGEYIDAGFDDYITKPIKSSDLLSVIKKNISQESIKEIQNGNGLIEDKKENHNVDILEALSEKLDVQTGLSYSMDDRDFYLEMLNTYLDEDKIAVMEEQYRNGDWDNYRITVHSIKSTSLSIGAIQLSEGAKALEFAARDNDVEYIEANHEKILEQYKIILSFIRDTLTNDIEQAEIENDNSNIRIETGNLEFVNDIVPDLDERLKESQILVVDDTDMYLQLIEKLLADKYNVITAKSAKDASKVLEQQHIDLILLDVHMPEISGLEFLDSIKQDPEYSDLPVILLTSDEDEETENTGFKEGAMDFIRKPFNGSIALQRISRVLELAYLQKYLTDEVELQTKKAEDRRIRVEKMTTQVVAALAGAIDAKDRYTNGHSARVARYSIMIGKRLGYDDELLKQLEYAALLHDVGKIGIPDEIIRKTSGLTDEEYEIVKSHPVIGAGILNKITEIPNIELGAKWHHERYDGSGYPDGLVGEEIPEVARIICVADTYDAMASKRSYRDILPQEVVKGEIEKGKNSQFDPVIADIMVDIINDDVNYELKE